MDALRADAIARARATPLEERARQALAAVREGIALKRIALRHRFPDLGEADIDERLLGWLQRDARTGTRDRDARCAADFPATRP